MSGTRICRVSLECRLGQLGCWEDVAGDVAGDLHATMFLDLLQLRGHMLPKNWLPCDIARPRQSVRKEL
jgi:hypothetical protein